MTKRNADKKAQTSTTTKKATATKVVDSTPAVAVNSPVTSDINAAQQQENSNMSTSAEQTQTPASNALTFVRNDKTRRSNMIVFDAPEGRRGSVRVSKTLFGKDQIPTTLTVEHPNFAAPKVPMAKLSAEERKTLRANKPKLTLAEKLQRAEDRAAKLRAKLNAPTAAAPAEQSAEPVAASM